MHTSAAPPLLAACRGLVPQHTPIWLMRQAGRILPAYRQLREEQGDIATLFNTPELAARITLMPVEQLGVDAAILFTDLVTPLQALGATYHYAPGPSFSAPVRSRSDVDALSDTPVVRSLGHVLETIRMVRADLPDAVALIGYAGAPFTLATWLVEGHGSRDFPAFRRMIHADPELAHRLLARLARLAGEFLQAQIEAGAQAVQLFDTSIGVLGPELYREFALPYVQRVLTSLTGSDAPTIYFPLHAAHLLSCMHATGADVLSVDWRTPLADAYARFGPQHPMQGNLDPCALYAPPAALDAAVTDVLAAAQGKPHIFNLGHGVLPDTPLENIRHLVRRVHAGLPSSTLEE
jgi:uroporphyrinogen decarboxylase